MDEERPVSVPQIHDCIVVGAGAAGITAAIFAARGGADVLVLESRPKPGAKILVSGGGRCNVLPSKVELSDFQGSGSRNSLRNILMSWPLDDVREFFEADLGVPLKVEASGKFFPQSDRAKDVVDALLAKLEASGARLVPGFRVSGIEHREHGSFVVRSEDGQERHGRKLVLATGGRSLPKSGSDGAGLEFARALGHSVAPTYPALVPLLSADERWVQLSGVSLRARVEARDAERLLETRSGDFLFTHRGFSGPVILDMSRHLTEPDSTAALFVQWGGGQPGEWEARLASAGGSTVSALLRRELPARLVALLLDRIGVSGSAKVAELPREKRKTLIEQLERFELPVSGDEGFRRAEVTGGGVPLAELRGRTLESRQLPGLHLCGEILDVTGRIGGFNFLWAWVTGRIVGRAMAKAGR